MPVFKMLIGLPGAGKDYWTVRNKGKGIVISSDEIRKELWGSEEEQKNPNEVFQLMFKRTVESLRAGFDCIYNATNINRKRRINLLKELKKTAKVDFESIAVVFAIPYKICLERNASRARIVPEFVIERMYRSFEIPSVYEGFDKVDIVKYEIPDYQTLDIMLSDSYEIPHDNPHHTLSIGAHSIKANEIIFQERKAIAEKYGLRQYFVIYEASRFHDIGKPFCKVFHSMKGDPTPFAHYYYHENVGAYDYLSYNSLSYALDVALLINLHMKLYLDKGAQDKIHQLYGEKIWDALKIINEADRKAH